MSTKKLLVLAWLSIAVGITAAAYCVSYLTATPSWADEGGGGGGK
jgi:hypothetical protein